MNRYTAMLLIFTTCLIVAGCRRGSSEPRKPMFIDLEGDILKGPRENAILFTVRPLDRKFYVYAKAMVDGQPQSIYTIESKVADKERLRKLMSDTITAQEALEKDQNSSKAVQAAKEAAVAEEEEIEFDELAKHAAEFFSPQEKKDPVKDYNANEFRKFIRRGDWSWKKKYWDKTGGEIFNEEILLTRPLDSGAINVATAVDMTQPDYIMAYRAGKKTPLGDLYARVIWNRKKDANGLYKKDVIEQIDNLKDQVRGQEMRIIRKYFLIYAAPLHVRPPANADEAKSMKEDLGIRDYDTLVSMVQTNPRGTLLNVDRILPALAKNPPDDRDLAKFKKFLKEKAPPSVYDALEDRFVGLNFDINLRSTDILIARTENDTYEDPDTNQVRDRGHLYLRCEGTFDRAKTAAVKSFLPKPPTKKETGFGSGGPGGGMMGMMGAMP